MKNEQLIVEIVRLSNIIANDSSDLSTVAYVDDRTTAIVPMVKDALIACSKKCAFLKRFKNEISEKIIVDYAESMASTITWESNLLGLLNWLELLTSKDALKENIVQFVEYNEDYYLI